MQFLLVALAEPRPLPRIFTGNNSIAAGSTSSECTPVSVIPLTAVQFIISTVSIDSINARTTAASVLRSHLLYRSAPYSFLQISSKAKARLVGRSPAGRAMTTSIPGSSSTSRSGTTLPPEYVRS